MADVLAPERSISAFDASSPLATTPSTVYMSNLKAADENLKLNDQERALYTRHLDNLYGPGGVDNPDGSRSSLYQTTVEVDGKFFTIPTVWNGAILPIDDAIKQVQQIGWDKFPSYSTEDEAESRYQQLHDYMERDTESFLKSRTR